MTFGFLRTRVGRRFLVVNLLTALVPVAVVTAVSFAILGAALRAQSEASLRRLGKSAGMATLAYLGSITDKLQVIRGADTPDSPFTRVGVAFASTGLPNGSGNVHTLTPTQIAQLQSGRPLLSVVPGPGRSEVVLALARLPWNETSQPLIWATVRTAALFGESDEAVHGEDAKLCIIESTSFQLIHCSPDVRDDERRLAVTHASPSAARPSPAAASEYRVSARDIYLRHRYGAPEWRLVVMQPSRIATAGAATLRNTFLLLAAALIVLIFAVSHAQIRRTTEPLTQLQEGTRRLQAGDFGTPVLVDGDDEYAEVATSFNGMAAALNRQITLLHNLDAVDRSALGIHDTQTVVRNALACVASSVPCTSVSMTIVSAADQMALATITLNVATGERSTTPSAFTAAERAELLANPRQLTLTGATGRRSYLPGPVDGDPPMHSAVLPLVDDHVLLGLIAVQHHDDALSVDVAAESRRLADRVALALSNVQLVTRLDALSAGTVLAFARAIDANSPWTAGHSERVTRVALEIGRVLELSIVDMDTLERGGLLHDIGKIAVSPLILDKAGKLSDDEWNVMRRHPVVGCEILSPIPAFADALPIVRSHHERMDGTGYPDRLYGDEIPYLARVLAVADVFDALASNRPYRAGMPTADACDIIQRGSGVHFDPRIVRAFLDAVHAGRIRASTPANDSHSLAAAVARARAGAPETV